MDKDSRFIEIIDRVNEVIARFKELNYSIRDMTKEELEYLPKLMIFHRNGREVYKNWDKIPERYKINREMYAICYDHNKGPIQFDGPPPLKSNCLVCTIGNQIFSS